MLFTVGALLTGCGEKKEETATEETTEETSDETEEETTEEETEAVQPPSFDDMDLSKIVTLGTYKGMELERQPATVADETVEMEIENALRSMPEEIEDGVVEEGDLVNLDFMGKIDGEEFEGGTAQGQVLMIGSNGFIEGFEEGMKGMKIGETKDIELKFPTEYNPEVAGKDVVFTVVVNTISRPLSEITEEWVVENTESKTIDEYRESVRENLIEMNENAITSSLAAQAWEKVVAEAEASAYPEEALEYGRELYTQNMEMYASYSQMTLEEFLESQDMTMEDYEEQAQESAEGIAKQMLVMNAIVQAEKLTDTDEEYKELFDKVLEGNQMTEEELTKQYGKENIRQNIFMQYVNKFLMDNAKVTEVTPTETPEAPEEAEEEAE